MKLSRIILPLLFSGLFFFSSNKLSAQCVGKGRALETIGMQGGLVLYNTFEVIGSLNDGYMKDAWKKETVLAMLDEQISMMGNIAAQYDTLGDSKFLSDPSDLESVKTLKKGALLLKKEAQALEDNINNPGDENSEAYQDARKEAWKLIEDILGLKNEDEK
jgi:hypothetical protein